MYAYTRLGLCHTCAWNVQVKRLAYVCMAIGMSKYIRMQGNMHFEAHTYVMQKSMIVLSIICITNGLSSGSRPGEGPSLQVYGHRTLVVL